MDAATARLAIQTRNKEIEQLMSRPNPDLLAVEELQSANVRDIRALREFAAQNIVNAAPRNPLRPELARFLDRNFTLYMKGAI